MQPGRPSSKREAPARSKDRENKGEDEAMGGALRSVYNTTLNEPVPDEMLDILRKLD